MNVFLYPNISASFLSFYISWTCSNCSNLQAWYIVHQLFQKNGARSQLMIKCQFELSYQKLGIFKKKGIACCFSTRHISISDFSIQWKSSEIGIILINLDICHLGHTPLSYFHTMSCQRAISVFTEYYSMWNLI